MLHHYQFSNLRLKHGPLITTLVDAVKFLLRSWFLLKNAQISNGVHNSYLQYVTISSQKLDIRHKENCDNSLFGLTAAASEEIFNAFFCCCCCHCFFITIYSFTIIKQKFYNCSRKNVLNDFHFECIY